MKSRRLFFTAAFCVLLTAGSLASAQADKLPSILLPGEDWKPAAEGLSFSDGLCSDAAGNVYFSEMRAKPPVIVKLAPDGTRTKIAEGPARSGTRLGPDGVLYAVGDTRAVAYALPGGELTVLAEKISTNDLAVSRKGLLYLTEPAKHQVTLIDPKTKIATSMDTGIKSPNGIGLSPDQKTLYVSDSSGLNTFAFAVLADGTLADRKPLFTMKAPENKPTASSGDGLTVDTAGRVYVTSAVGIQVFAATGEALGVIPKPKQGSVISATFGGKDLDYLYVSTTDALYRRKVLAKGCLSYLPPLAEKN